MNKALEGQTIAILTADGVERIWAVNPDKLRMEPAAVEFVRAFAASGKPLRRSATARGRSPRPMSCAAAA
jgi:hypothetical protein